MAKHRKRQAYNGGHSDDHIDIDPHIDKDQKRDACRKGFDEIVLRIFG